MLSLLVLAALSTTPTVGLTLSARIGKGGAPAAHLDAIESELVAGGLSVRRFTSACDGVRACLAAAAREEKVPLLVGVSLAQRRNQTTIDLEGVRAEDGATVAQETFVITGERLGEADLALVRGLAARLKEALRPLDAPVREEVTPVAKDVPGLTAPVVDDLAPQAPSRAPAWVMLGCAGASAVASGVFVGLATSARGRVEGTADPSPLTRAQAQGLADEANRDYTIALVTGVVSGALLTGALTWLLVQ